MVGFPKEKYRNQFLYFMYSSCVRNTGLSILFPMESFLHPYIFNE